MKLTMLGTGNALVTECYNTCFVLSDEYGHFLLHYSLFDAYRAGFRKVVFVVKEETAEEFREIGGLIARVVFNADDEGVLAAVRARVDELLEAHPLYPGL